MKTFSALLAICAGNSPVHGEFPAQRPVTRSFDVFFDVGPNKRLSKQSWSWWFETLSPSLWRHRNEFHLHETVHARPGTSFVTNMVVFLMLRSTDLKFWAYLYIHSKQCMKYDSKKNETCCAGPQSRYRVIIENRTPMGNIFATIISHTSTI